MAGVAAGSGLAGSLYFTPQNGGWMVVSNAGQMVFGLNNWGGGGGYVQAGIGANPAAATNYVVRSLQVLALNSSAFTTVQPVPDNSLLLNPGKGYVEYGYTSQYTAKVTAVGYGRWDWSLIEPAEGVYNWSPVDSLLSSFAAYGLPSAVGVMSVDCLYTTNQPTPAWVFQPGTNAQTHAGYANGAVSVAVVDPCGSTNKMTVAANWNDPVYLARLHDFINAFAARYNGNTNLAWLDIRDYGVWGEGNGNLTSGPTNLAQGPLLTNYYLPYVQAFTNSLLLEDAWYGSVGGALAALGTGAREDGICNGGTAGNNQWNGSMVLMPYPYRPAVMEYWGQPTNVYRLSPENELMIYVAGGRPSYLQFNGDGLYPTRTNFYNLVGNVMGYHFVLQQASLPKSLQPGVAVALSFTWLNDGVAPIYRPCSVAVALLDSYNQVIEKQWLTNSSPGNWMPGVSVTETYSNVSFSTVPVGGKLAVGLFGSQTDARPTYRLGIQGRTMNGWYVISGSAAAVSPAWTNRAGGSWQTSSNWSGNFTPGGADVTADFSQLGLTNNTTVTLDGAVTIGNLVFGDLTHTFNWNLNSGAGGSLTLAVGSGGPTIAVNNQATAINASLGGIVGLVKQGPGTLMLGNTNNYVGNTVVSGGTLRLVSPGAYSSAYTSVPVVAIGSGAVIEFDNWNWGSTCSFGDLDFGSSRIVLNGGTLRFVGSASQSSSRGCNLGSTGGTLDSSVAGKLWDITYQAGYPSMSLSGLMTLTGAGNGEIDKNVNETTPGAGAVLKTGAGAWTLAGTNAYTGNTTVSAGTLAISQPTLAANSTVSVAGGGRLQLTFTGTNPVASLVLNGVGQPAGIYNAANAPAYLAGAGSLQVLRNPLASNPTNIICSAAGKTLSLSWPPAYLGWMMQSNSVNLAGPANWYDLSNTATGTNYSITPDLTRTNVFFRLRHP